MAVSNKHILGQGETLRNTPFCVVLFRATVLLCFIGFNVFFGTVAHAQSGAEDISLSSPDALARTILAALPEDMPADQKSVWETRLWAADDLSIQVNSLHELGALLPLPAKTIYRLTKKFARQQIERPLAYQQPANGLGFADAHNPAQPATPHKPILAYGSAAALLTHAMVKQLIWQRLEKVSEVHFDGSLNQVPPPPSFPVPPPPPLSPIVSSLAPSAAAFTPLTTAAIATGAAAATAGVAAASSSSDDAAIGGSNGGGSNGGGSDGGGDNGGGSDDENLDTAVWETAEYQSNIGLDAISASTAFARGYRGDGVTVSVLDSPFDTDHADLSATFVSGFNAFDNSTTVHCPTNGCSSSHGTHVAGIIGGQKNDVGTHGVAPDVQIKPVKIFENDLSFVSNAQLVEAINAGSGAAITAMNNSWGSSKIDSVTHSGTTYYYKRPYLNYADNSSSEYIWAYQGSTALTGLPPDEITAWQNATQNTIIVFANGNDGLNTATGRVQLYSDANAQNEAITIDNSASAINQNIPSFRGSYPVIDSSLSGEWLTVIALDANNQIASFSNGCGEARAFCIAAPGVNINAPIDVDDTTNSSDASFGVKNGTSMAAPHVTGAIALLKQQFPNLTPSQLTSLVLSTATDLGAAGTDEIYGVGMLNLAEASRPQGSVSVAGADGQALSGVSPAQTAIQSSSVFGQAFMRKLISIGLVDSYQRSYVFEPALSAAQTYAVSAQDVVQLLSADTAEQHRFDIAQDTFFSISLPEEGAIADEQFSITAQAPGISLALGQDKATTGMLQRHQKAQGISDYLVSRSAFSQLSDASKNFRFMNPRFQLSKNLQLEMSHIQGSFDADRGFAEFSTYLGWSEQHNHLGASVGVLRENNTILGASMTGFYAPSTPAISKYITVETRHPIAQNTILSSRFINMATDVKMQNAEQVALSGIQANSYQLALDRWGGEADWLQKFIFSLPLATHSGSLQQMTTKGYSGNGYLTTIEHFDLANRSRQVDFGFSHQQSSWQGGKWLLMLHASQNVGGVKNKTDTGLYFGLNQLF